MASDANLCLKKDSERNVNKDTIAELWAAMFLLVDDWSEWSIVVLVVPASVARRAWNKLENLFYLNTYIFF